MTSFQLFFLTQYRFYSETLETLLNDIFWFISGLWHHHLILWLLSLLRHKSDSSIPTARCYQRTTSWSSAATFLLHLPWSGSGWNHCHISCHRWFLGVMSQHLLLPHSLFPDYSDPPSIGICRMPGYNNLASMPGTKSGRNKNGEGDARKLWRSGKGTIHDCNGFSPSAF